MGYIVDNSFVKVDCFNKDFKFIETISVIYKEFGSTNLRKTFNNALNKYFKEKEIQFKGYLVILEPHHKTPEPLMFYYE